MFQRMNVSYFLLLGALVTIGSFQLRSLAQKHREPSIVPLEKKEEKNSHPKQINIVYDIHKIRTTPKYKEKSKKTTDREKQLEGSWQLIERFFWTGGGYREQSDQKGTIYFTDDIFEKHLNGYVFMGNYEVFDSVELESTPASITRAEKYIIHFIGVSSTLTKELQSHEYYQAERKGRFLVLTLLGSHIGRRNIPKEISVYRKQ